MLRIDFIRAQRGKVAFARCSTPKGELRIDGGYAVAVPHASKRAAGKIDGTDGVIYKMIVALADDGFAGEKFEAHDGRLICLEGIVDKLAVPVAYGGTPRRV